MDKYATEFAKCQMSLRQFCEENNVSYMKMYNHIKSNRPDINLSRKNNGKGSRSKADQERRCSGLPSKEQFMKWYHQDKMTYEEMGNVVGRSASAICHHFKKIGITGRTRAERNELWMTEEHKEHWRKLANEGKTGVFAQSWGNHKDTWIEKSFVLWCEENMIQYTHQFQITNDSHRYDFLLDGTDILIEVDGVYFHKRPKQEAKDRKHERFAEKNGYRVIRFTDTEIKETKSTCFIRLLNEL